MIYLILAILISAAFNIGLTWAKKCGCEERHITWFNYLMASIGGIVMMLSGNVFQKLGVGLSFGDLFQTMGGEAPTPAGSVAFSGVLGAFTGVFYIMGLIAMQKSIAKNGPSPTAIFGRLGILIPILISIVLWNEMPTAICWIGILIAFAALVVFNYDGGFKFNVLLILVWFSMGMGELMNKLFTQWCLADYKPLFLFGIFFSAFALCSIWMLLSKEKHPFTLKEAIMGMGIGIVNLCSSVFIIRALEFLPSNVVYPVLCSGAILVVALAGRAFFGEKLGKKGLVALGLTVISLILVNL